MPSLLQKTIHKSKRVAKYFKPMPSFGCELPHPLPLIVDSTHRIPLTVDVSSGNGSVEKDALAVRLIWCGENGEKFYGGQERVLRKKSMPDDPRPRVIIKTNTPTQPGNYSLEAYLVRSRRSRLIGKSGFEWSVIPLVETNGELNYGEYMIGMDASMKCNLECIFCLRVFMEHIHETDVSPEELKRLADQAFEQCSGISLSLGAEPTMNPQFDQLVELLGEHPYLHTTMTTNGTTLGGKIGKLLVEKGFKEIHVSLDGATKKTVEGIREGIRFEHVIKNLEILKQRKKELNTPYPRLKMHFAMMKRNIHELPAFVDLAHRLGAAEIRFQHFIIPHESLIDESLWFDPERANQFMKEALDKCHEYGIATDAPPFFKLHSKSNGKKQLRTQQCHWPWKGMLIDPDGNATPCCQWKGPSLGNVNKSGFQDVWNGPAYQQLRRDWISGDLNEYCQNCSALMEGDVNDFSSFIAAEYEEINLSKAPEHKRLVQIEPAPTSSSTSG